MPGTAPQFELNDFIADWELEIRAGYTPLSELDGELEERLNESLSWHFTPPDWLAPDLQTTYLARLRDHTQRFIASEIARENTWNEDTHNDRLTRAFAELRSRGLIAIECAGLTIQDGWARVGLEQTTRTMGAVFFHHEDIIDAIGGLGLLLAFGACEPASPPAADEAVARLAVASLNAAGISTSWSGSREHRILLPDFRWQRRRWTRAPRRSLWQRLRGARRAVAPGTHTRASQLALQLVTDAELARWQQPVVAFRTTWGFHGIWSQNMRAAWKMLGGERGHVGHAGLPHTFVRAGEMTTLIPRDAFRNLEPEAATQLRARATAAG
jgi:hypothetical protein